MGMFDSLRVRDPRFVCPEGHDLCDEEFQTKDFGCTLGTIHIGPEGVLSRDALGIGDPLEGCKRPLTTTMNCYTSCPTCPVFIAPISGNLWRLWCEFDVEIVDDKIVDVKVLAETRSFAEFAETARKSGCIGPLTEEEAKVERAKIHEQSR